MRVWIASGLRARASIETPAQRIARKAIARLRRARVRGRSAVRTSRRLCPRGTSAGGQRIGRGPPEALRRFWRRLGRDHADARPEVSRSGHRRSLIDRGRHARAGCRSLPRATLGDERARHDEHACDDQRCQHAERRTPLRQPDPPQLGADSLTEGWVRSERGLPGGAARLGRPLATRNLSRRPSLAPSTRAGVARRRSDIRVVDFGQCSMRHHRVPTRGRECGSHGHLLGQSARSHEGSRGTGRRRCIGLGPRHGGRRRGLTPLGRARRFSSRGVDAGAHGNTRRTRGRCTRVAQSATEREHCRQLRPHRRRPRHFGPGEGRIGSSYAALDLARRVRKAERPGPFVDQVEVVHLLVLGVLLGHAAARRWLGSSLQHRLTGWMRVRVLVARAAQLALPTRCLRDDGCRGVPRRRGVLQAMRPGVLWLHGGRLQRVSQRPCWASRPTGLGPCDPSARGHSRIASIASSTLSSGGRDRASARAASGGIQPRGLQVVGAPVVRGRSRRALPTGFHVEVRSLSGPTPRAVQSPGWSS